MHYGKTVYNFSFLMEWTNSVQGDESHIYFESYFPPRISLQTP